MLSNLDITTTAKTIKETQAYKGNYPMLGMQQLMETR